MAVGIRVRGRVIPKAGEDGLWKGYSLFWDTHSLPRSVGVCSRSDPFRSSCSGSQPASVVCLLPLCLQSSGTSLCSVLAAEFLTQKGSLEVVAMLGQGSGGRAEQPTLESGFIRVVQSG